MFDATVDYIAIQAQNTRAGTLASGSNWMAGLCTLRAARRLRKPFIYDVRGLWPMTRAAIDPGYAKQPGYAVQMKFEWAIMRAADAVMVISGPLKDLAIKNGVNPNKISVVPNMTAEVLKIPITMPQQSEIWTLGHAGSLTPYEGLDLILHLLYRYREINGKLVHFWIAGTGTYKTKLEELVKELELSKQVHFLGRVSRNTVLQRILASDVMVYPRQNSEVFQLIPALKPVEAMQMGTLTLMSNLAPHVELSRAGRARLATAPNPNKFDDTAVLNDWHEALTSLLAMSPIEKTEMRSQAQDWCRIHRSSQKVLQPWLEQFSRSLL
jgi:glycosyltransferase involved in cell wall biosynthesis